MNDPKRNVALVGMMGAGKSTVGALLARRIGWSFYDTDLILEGAFGRPIAKIFEEAGEEVFRAAERTLLRLLASLDNAVLAMGGGLWSSPEARERLAGFAYTAYLDVPPEVLWRRLERDGLRVRPLLRSPDPRGVLDRLLAEREPAYALADWRISAGSSEPEVVVEEILAKLRSAGLVARPVAAA